MVDRPRRIILKNLIDKFLSRELSAFEFDEALEKIESDDETIAYVLSELWYFYDDVTDHYAELSKEEWDYIQRLSLILASDGEIVHQTACSWSHFCMIAVLLTAVWACCTLGFPGIPFLLMWFGGMLFTYLVSRHRHKRRQRDTDICPFSSFRQLASLRRMTEFKKPTYTPYSSGKKIRHWEIIEIANNSKFLASVNAVLWNMLTWGLLWPLKALCLVFPEQKSMVMLDPVCIRTEK